MENYTLAVPAPRPGSTPPAASMRTQFLQDTPVRIRPQNAAVPSLVDGRDAVAGVSNHDATAKSGPPRGEPR